MKRAYRKQANVLTPQQAAYLAGYVDGEGCISANLRRYGTSIDGRLEIGSVSRQQLEQFKIETGVGSICTKKKRSKKAKRLHVWNVSICSVASVLEQLLPYLRLKKRQAELMLALAAYEYPSKVTDEVQLKTIEAFRGFNRRGEITLHTN